MAPFPQGKFIDPSFLAQLQAEQRGLKDLLKDTSIQRQRTKQDTRTQVGGIKRERQRTVGGLRRDRRRGVSDIRLGAERGREDFGLQLQGMIRNYQQLGAQQGQQIGSQGLGGAGSGAARLAASRRAGNLAFERQPIDIGVRRLGEDETRQIGRLRSDTGRGIRQTRQDARRDIRLASREGRRTLGDLLRERGRGRRELKFSQPALASQARFQAGLLRQQFNQ